ncbi:uncharacterized protein LOC130046258 [Ostrea edulis]|uniref:uncharacterized protein LOC130046258 n=1 Tax=Ostrea edulis TaxID=37623 RepID=UPI002095E4C0|nr:uncharacterized protein LOC130046258 [Ostrea edulis]
MYYLLIIMYFMSSSLKVESLNAIQITSYDSLVSYLSNGAEASYFFNISTCVPANVTPEFEIPVIGGKIKLFVDWREADDESGVVYFSETRYTDEKVKDLNEEIQSLWLFNDTSEVYWGKPGFFVNNTADTKGVFCNWTKGEGKILVTQPNEQKQLTSFKEIRSMLTAGEEVRWIVKMGGCKCPPDPYDCGDSSFGDTIKDFKIKNGSISFSSSMTVLIPLSWQYVRFVAFGHVYENNTANFMASYFDPTTWENGENDMIVCPISSDLSAEGARFFTTRK